MRPLDRRSRLLLIGLIPAAAAVYAFAVWPMTKFPLLYWDASLWIAMALCVVGVWAAGWFTVARHELLPARGLLRSLTDPLLVALLVALIVGNPVYHLLNALLDRGPPRHLTYVVADRNCTSGKRGTRAALVLRSDSPSQPARVSLEVTKPVCRDAIAGAEVLLAVKPGFFGSAWVTGYTVQP